MVSLRPDPPQKKYYKKVIALPRNRRNFHSFGTVLLVGLCFLVTLSVGGKNSAGIDLSPAQQRTGKEEVERYATPKCAPHPAKCEGLCHTVSEFVRQRRIGTLANPKAWSWYYAGVLEYYRCSNAKIIVEVGVAWGAQTAYHLKHGSDFIEEYHVVDPFLAGYDPDDPMSKNFEAAAPGAKPEDISRAWFQGMAMDLGKDGMYMKGTADEKIDPPPGCLLRMHHAKSVEGAELFGDHSVDAVFIDGLHTYEGVLDDINAWMSKIRVGGTLIFNDFNSPAFGVNKAVWEIADKHNIKIAMIDGTNAIFGGSQSCVKGPKPMRIA
mmetsp:Transcript_4876/g.7400  ORF Transcript_4876/g.7400 Transcript_4876/m.7400 type:complete len:323 (-) Transcript_4876:159-1127(-)